MLLNGSEKADVLTGGADADTLYGFGGNDKLVGNGGDDVLAGMAGNDTLQGGEGDDYLMGGAGSDTLDGGAGVDWAAYEDATSGVTVSLAVTTAQNTGGGGSDKLISIENLYGSAFNDVLTGDANTNNLAGDAGNDTLSGGAGDDNLFGGVGADSLLGGQGDDWLVGGAGNDTIDGGSGADWAVYEDATSGVTVNLTLTAAQNTGGGGVDKLVSIENVYGSAFNDVLVGDSGVNYLAGGDGNDSLVGGAGDDHLQGGGGSNTIDGGEGFDVVNYDDGRTVGVNVYLSEGREYSISGNFIYSDTLVSIEAVIGSSQNDSLFGSSADNYIFGGAGDDTIAGGLGNDALDGGEGNDQLNSLDGNDTLVGGAGNDTFSIGSMVDQQTHAFVEGGEGSDTFGVNGPGAINVDLSVTGEQQIGTDDWTIGRYVTLSSIENLTGSYEADHLTGDVGANRLSGGSGNDTLSGGEGMDTLVGGAGHDVLIGGDGKDTFVFAYGDTMPGDATGDGADVITDFKAEDQLKFSDSPLAISYVESTATSYASALATVNSMLMGPSTFHEYIAFQVGADVYVFSGHSDPNGAGLENVIKLAGVDLGAVDYYNFLS